MIIRETTYVLCIQLLIHTSYGSPAIVYSMPALRTLSYLDIKALGASCELLSNSTGTEVPTVYIRKVALPKAR